LFGFPAVVLELSLGAPGPADFEHSSAHEAPTGALTEPGAARVRIHDRVDLVDARQWTQNPGRGRQSIQGSPIYTPRASSVIIKSELATSWGQSRHVQDIEIVDLAGASSGCVQLLDELVARAAACWRHDSNFCR